MTLVRARRPYFNVPASQQPVRVREALRRKPSPPATSQYTNPLEQLIVVPHRYPLRASEEHGLGVNDGPEALDAVNECAHGRLPHDRTAPCGCWPGEPVPLAWPEPVYPEPVADLIPDWLLGDVEDYLGWGWSVKRIARAILPATGCPDVPSCEELLNLRLKDKATSRSPRARP